MTTTSLECSELVACMQIQSEQTANDSSLTNFTIPNRKQEGHLSLIPRVRDQFYSSIAVFHKFG